MSIYKSSIQKDQLIAKEYYEKSLIKTQQQVFLEELLINHYSAKVEDIADIACGGGTLSVHLKNIYTDARFTLVDFNEDALKIARGLVGELNMTYINDDIYELAKLKSEMFDSVFCWQTLSWLDKPEKALDSLIRITKKGGRIFLSSLFNLNYDVDLYTNVFDHTRESTKEGLYLHYNTYSAYTVSKWLEKKVSNFKFHEFTPASDIIQNPENRGLGTFTVFTNQEQRMQISGGLLMNWAFLVIQK